MTPEAKALVAECIALQIEAQQFHNRALAVDRVSARLDNAKHVAWDSFMPWQNETLHTIVSRQHALHAIANDYRHHEHLTSHKLLIAFQNLCDALDVPAQPTPAELAEDEWQALEKWEDVAISHAVSVARRRMLEFQARATETSNE